MRRVAETPKRAGRETNVASQRVPKAAVICLVRADQRPTATLSTWCQASSDVTERSEESTRQGLVRVGTKRMRSEVSRQTEWYT